MSAYRQNPDDDDQPDEGPSDDTFWILVAVTAALAVGVGIYALNSSSASAATPAVGGKSPTVVLTAGQTQTQALNVGDSMTVIGPTGSTPTSASSVLQVTSSDASIGSTTFRATARGTALVTAGTAILNVLIS
jgi:hypothetical protein